MILPTIALSVILLGVTTRTVRSTIKEILQHGVRHRAQAKGMNDRQILFHVLKNAAPVCLAVMGLQAGNLIGGSDPDRDGVRLAGHRLPCSTAPSSCRDLPILQGTTLVLAFFFMLLNLTVDVIQTTGGSAHQARLTMAIQSPSIDMTARHHRARGPLGRAELTGNSSASGLRRDPVTLICGGTLLRDRTLRADGAMAGPGRPLQDLDDGQGSIRWARPPSSSAPTNSAATGPRA